MFQRICTTIAVLFLALSMPCLAQQDDNSDALLECQLLIEQGLDDNLSGVMSRSKSLSETQRLLLYVSHEKDKGLPFALNLFLGFGIGSWVQGHTTGGLIGTIGMGLGVVAAAADGGGGVGSTIGAVLIGGAWITGLILPWTYGSKYNRNLRTALRMGSTLSKLNIGPDVRQRADGTLTPGISLRYSF